jgi:hypothetical protein
MKNIFLKSTMFSMIFLLFACSDTEVLTDEVLDGTTTGGILRTLESQTLLSLSSPEEGFELLLEIQDEEDGNLSDFIEVYARYNHITGGGANNRDETLIKTIPNSAFILGNRLPRAIVETNLAELESALNLTPAEYGVGDRFIVRVELVFKDGRRWSNFNTSSTVLGNLFFASPFVYNANVVN